MSLGKSVFLSHSRGRWLMLIPFVVCDIPVFNFITGLDKIMRDFSWETVDKGRGSHLVRWDVVSRIV